MTYYLCIIGDILKEKKKPFLFRIVAGTIRIFYRKRTYWGLENLPDEPSIIISNHCKSHGPIANQLFFPTDKKIWCIGQMMDRKEAVDYMFQDFWSNKPKCVHWLYKIIAHIMAPLMSYLMRNADTIAVYKDSRIITTFKHTVEELTNGNHIIIFPENSTPYNGILNDFQDKYIDIAKLYHKKYGKLLNFVPMYNCPDLKKLVLGKPIQFNPDIDMAEQRLIINNYLKNEITKIAKDLPRHKVYPYANIRKKHYPMSKDE